jgi:hypothetical protein
LFRVAGRAGSTRTARARILFTAVRSVESFSAFPLDSPAHAAAFLLLTDAGNRPATHLTLILPKSERLILLVAALAALVLRGLALFRYRFDSDEQQHLHVAWGWTAGLVQYRDVFDNHPPLFHLATAPLLALLGERPDILLWMRLPMLALFAFLLYGTFELARRLYDTPVALRAIVLLALFPPFFLKSLEYRPDNLWNALWIATLLALLAARPRPFLVGLLLGCALAVSLKTTLLVATICGAALVLRIFTGKPVVSTSTLARAAAGFVVVPAALAIYFVSAGAWDELVYCNFVFNGRLALLRKELWIGRALFPLSAALVLWFAWRHRHTEHPVRYFFAIAIAVFTITLTGFWPLISTRDFLPLMPLVAIFAAAAHGRARRPLRALCVTLVVLLFSLWYYADRFENNADWHITMMNQALRLSRPGEPVMDYKGETIYRRRPFYYAFELVTRLQMEKGIIADTIPEDIVRTRTHVAQADGPMWPPRARAFLREHFLDMGRLRASGQWIAPDGTFTIAVPGEYVVVHERGEARGAIDGQAYTAARTLAPGSHRWEGDPHVAVLWAPAFRRGHSPFHLRDREF